MHSPKKLLNALDSNSSTEYKKITNLKYFVFDSPYQKQLLSIVHNIDSLIDTNATLKNSKRTSANLFSVGNDVFFGKHVRFYNKVFYTRLRYFIHPTRDLWAAWIAKKLENSGILTPKVYAIGQRRNLGLITDTYIITEALTNAQSVHSIVQKQSNALWILELGGKVLRQLHDSGITHGDAKLENVYIQNNSMGFWDLDSAKIFKEKIPKAFIVNDLARFFSSFLKTADQGISQGNEFNCTSIVQLADILAKNYGIDAKKFLPYYYEKWHSKLKLQHFNS